MVESSAEERTQTAVAGFGGLGYGRPRSSGRGGPGERGAGPRPDGRRRDGRPSGRLAASGGDQGGSPMKRRRARVRRKWLVPLALLLLPPLFWALVLAITTTEWARSRIVARLSAATGRPIHLGALNIGPLGGVRLADLAIGAPGADSDPWLKVA